MALLQRRELTQFMVATNHPFPLISTKFFLFESISLKSNEERGKIFSQNVFLYQYQVFTQATFPSLKIISLDAKCLTEF